MKLYVAGIKGAAELAALRELTPHDEVWLAKFPATTPADHHAFVEAEVVLGPFPGELLAAAKALRWIQLLGVGIDGYRQLTWPPPGRPPVCTTLHGLLAEPMAQSVLAGILALNRGLQLAVPLQAAHDWQKDYLHSQLHVLRHAHVLLLGAGSVNRRVRELLAPFGCTFTVYARRAGDIQGHAALDAALPHADIVCAALPDTPETRGLLDAARIARFKPGALFVNVGRGSLVDETALAAALRAGRLRGAVLDVTRQEPLPREDPLWDCPGLLLTQHSAAGSHRELLDAIGFFGTNLARYRAGEPLLNVVDWDRGY